MMTANTFGDTILEREFEATDLDGSKSIIKLRIGIPYLKTDEISSLKWHCAYQITGKGSEKIKVAQGMDAIDAMIMSLQLADVFLRNYQKDTKITWLGENWLGLISEPITEFTEAERIAIFDDESNPFKTAFDEFFRNRKSNRSSLEKPDQPE